MLTLARVPKCRSALPALADLGALDNLAQRYKSARTCAFQPRSYLQQRDKEQEQQQQHLLNPPPSLLDENFEIELKHEVEKQAAEVWASVHPQVCLAGMHLAWCVYVCVCAVAHPCAMKRETYHTQS